MDTSKPYLINVAQLKESAFRFGEMGYHFLFAAQTDYGLAHEAYTKIKAAFPAPAYKVEMTHWQCVGHAMDEKAIDSLPRP